MKNILYIVALLVLLGAGAFIYLQKSADSLILDPGAANYSVQDLTAAYMERRIVLAEVTIDKTILTDVRYTSLRSFSRTVAPRPVGRINPFDTAATANNR